MDGAGLPPGHRPGPTADFHSYIDLDSNNQTQRIRLQDPAPECFWRATWPQAWPLWNKDAWYSMSGTCSDFCTVPHYPPGPCHRLETWLVLWSLLVLTGLWLQVFGFRRTEGRSEWLPSWEAKRGNPRSPDLAGTQMPLSLVSLTPPAQLL